MSFLFGRRAPESKAQATADRLHDALVAAARQPVFYLDFGVPDTFEGRFDLLVLYLSVVLRRLGQQGAEGEKVAQLLVDVLFARFDIALRELGVSDIGVPKRMKRLAQAFRGRTVAYHAALEAGDEPALADAIARNVLERPDRAVALAQHMMGLARVMADIDLASPDAPLLFLAEPVEV